MELMDFDFIIDNTGEIEDISRYNDEYPREVCQEVLQKLIDKKRIVIGEKTEGNLFIEDGIITLDYKWCSEVGEDWDSDVWEEEREEIPLSEIE